MNPQDNPPLNYPPTENIIFQIRRHPIGILAVYIISAIVLIALAIVAFGVAPKYITSYSSSQVLGIAAVGYFIFLTLIVGFVYIAHVVYWDNSWTLSDESLAQVSRTSLFDKQSSHLSLGNLQDVTATQDSILQHLFKYGTLSVETAGEKSKFTFTYCPNPDVYAQHILEARERFEQANRINNGLKSPIQDRTAYQQPVPQETPPPIYPIPPQPPAETN